MDDLDPLNETRGLVSGDSVDNADVKIEPMPESIGRYRIDRVLGKGGFGLVYLAYDDQLSRPVAIKVPHASLITKPSDAEPYLIEARTVANLDHAHIVPVHDIGSTEDYPCYIVSKFVEGTNLSTKLKQQRFGIRAAAELVATVAEALHYAHKQGLVHRDIKPGNILLGTDGKPYVVDFGLALREENIGKGPRYAGTLIYMSPEQARGEGHRVDGRSDIFSLGIMLYEMLVGRRPFQAETRQELLEQISTMEARPPRQIDDGIPKELERICLKAISKRAIDRYTTAQDFTDDLRHYLDQLPLSAERESSISRGAVTVGSDSTRIEANTNTPSVGTDSSKLDADSQPIRIVPKGLRSFDAHDADFFLELLPGARDRNGLPDSLRFWKTRIEEFDPDDTFSIGLIYGPSGCGKSSLVKAGLLPRLIENLIPVYVEATPDETETRLLHGLRKRCSALDDNLNLKQTLAALRRGLAIPTGKKVLIVLDQFEQWLHAKKDEENTDLVQALRQCDGGRVQCIVMVRDDFWLAATRFMGELEVELLQGQNTALADLFDLTHARKVLAAFGRAFGRIPEAGVDTSREQREFLDQSVVGMAEEGKVICVRLALFSEMMKGKEWSPATLREIGGTEGVGVNFLEETFSAQTAHPKHRLHQKAARAVLNSLLPESGSDIKGEMKSYHELLEDSGYAARPQDFVELIKILDSEIRLITPTDPEGVESDDDSVAQFETGKKYYQLTHDYLVPSLRDWLTRKQRETRRGRAELRLAERSVTWKAKPENRQLPSTVEWLRIQALTNHSNWNDAQRKMMQRSNRVKGIFWSGILALLVIAGVGTQQAFHGIDRQNTRVRVESLQGASGSAVPFALDSLDQLPRELVLTELQERFADATGRQKLNLSYGLAHFDQFEIDTIVTGLIDEDTEPEEIENILRTFRKGGALSLQKIQTASAVASGDKNWVVKSRLAIAALHLGDESLAAEMLRDQPAATGQPFDPVERTVLIKEFANWSGAVEPLATFVANTENPALRSGICLAVGGVEKPGQSAKDAWQPILQNWGTEATRSGTHSAAAWALNRWKLDLPDVKETPAPAKGRNWWHADGLRFVKIPAGKVRGAQKDSAPIAITDDFWMSDCEITVGLFKQFMEDKEYHQQNPELKPDWEGAEVFGNDDSPNLPVQNVTWYDAVMFSNWLSWKLDLQPCYEIKKSAPAKVDAKQPYTVSWLRNADGIRLPTEGEWEYACRAETMTQFNFGDDEDGLVDYGWIAANGNSRTHSIGTKRCNAWGLFDVHGNVFEWCWGTDSFRVYRGGCWRATARFCESSYSGMQDPSHRSSYLGFRVSRGPSSQASEVSK